MKYMQKVIVAISATLIALTINIIPALAASSYYYAQTTVYFNLPGDSTFSVGLPSTYSMTAITGTSEGGATATSPTWISFNFTTGTSAALVQPYSAGVSGDAQTGPTKPIFYIQNTGNSNETISFRFSGVVGGGYTAFGNATCTPTGGCGTATSALTAISNTYVVLATSLNTTSKLNVTMYANDSGAVPGTTTATLYINGTANTVGT